MLARLLGSPKGGDCLGNQPELEVRTFSPTSTCGEERGAEEAPNVMANDFIDLAYVMQPP